LLQTTRPGATRTIVTEKFYAIGRREPHDDAPARFPHRATEK